MRWVKRGATRREREKGAVATVVAVLMSSGVVMGMLALSVDVGSIMYERRQLQNGADAAANALANICLSSSTACDPTNTTTAARLQALVNANSQDGTSQFKTVAVSLPNGVCGRLTGGTNIPACPSATSNASITDLTQCPPLPSSLTGTGASIPYVEAYTLTKTTGGSSILPKFFSQALTGGSGADASVSACARAAWGPGGPGSINVLPLAMSECDWKTQTGYPATTNYPDAPSGAWPGYSNTDARPDWPTFEDTVYSKGNNTTCDTSSPGGTAPGGFAWLDGFTGSCSGVVTDNSWIHGDTGADGCDATLFNPLRGTTVYIPVFDCMMSSNPGRDPIATDNCSSGSGNNTYYHIAGFASFYITGWRLTKGDQVSIKSGVLCGSGASDRCVSGWFLKNLVQGGDIVPPTATNPNYGLQVVTPAG